MNANKVNIHVKALTPVHIGSGNELKGNYEYIFFPKENVIAVISPTKILSKIGVENIDKWIAVIDNEKNLLEGLPKLKMQLLVK